MNMLKTKTCILFFVLFFVSVTQAETGADPLSGFLEDFKSLQAGFTQTLLDETGQQLEKTEGVLYLQQSGQFHWAYQQPYHQQIISDGTTLWIYDEDLEQVTLRPMGESIDQTPAGIILGNNDIETHFVKVDMGNIEGYDWIELTPKDLEATYRNIRFGFDQHQLGMMIIADNLGQVTRIDFTDVRKNPEIDSSLFEFDIPEGIDVIDEREFDTTDPR